MLSPANIELILESGSGVLQESGSALLLETSGNWTSTTLDVDLVAYLSAAIGLPVYAPLRRGNRYRAPVNVPDAPATVSYHRIHTERDKLLSRASGGVRAEYQISIFAQLFDDALPVAESVRYALQDYSGTMGSTEVLGVDLDDEASAWLENEDPKKAGKYRLVQEYTITYRESVRAS